MAEPFENEQPNPITPADPEAPTPPEVEDVEPMDPAQQSLADALKVSFGVLQVVMFALLVIYLVSGLFTVEPQEKAVVLFFGAIQGDTPSEQVIEEGIHFALPFPIQQVVKIPTSERRLSLDEQFMFQMQGSHQGKTTAELAASGGGSQLNPELDGFLLTGDGGIVHAQWSVGYRIDDPAAFIQNVGDPTDARAMDRSAETFVTAAAERAIVQHMAGTEVDRIFQGLNSDDFNSIKRIMQTTLDEVEAGIEVTNVTADRPVFPLSVRNDFQAATSAENEKARLIEEAQQERNKVLGEVAGEAYEPLWQLVLEYERAVIKQDADRIAELDEQMDEAFKQLLVSGTPIGGEVAEMINEARTYRTQIAQQVRSEAETFSQLLPLWRENPRIVESRMWQDAREDILASDSVETFYLPSGSHLYIEGNRDPRYRKRREEALLQAEQQAQLEEAQDN